ncbi:helix-turn-helix domain-containing protein [Azospirillum brasilense]|nr:helix-turn-helix domain-containing protein [Azospirillum brasilense]
MIRGGAAGGAPVGWLLEQLDREWRGETVGSQHACNGPLRLMFVHALRAHLSEQPPQGDNWLAARLDPSIGRALDAFHAEPCSNWTLAELAGIAGRSRSSFAAAFRERVGVPPIDYMLRWCLAATRLRQGQESVSAIAASLGYLSDSAFSATFRRIMGVSPARYRRGADRQVVSDRGPTNKS